MELLRLGSLTDLGSLSMRELAAVAPYAAEALIPAGRRVLLEGPFAQELVLVATGRGSVRCAGETVGELGRGDIYGTLAPRRAAYPTATITAVTPLRLVTFSTRDIRRLRAAAPDALDALLAACAQAPQGRGTQRRPAVAPATAVAPAPAAAVATVAA